MTKIKTVLASYLLAASFLCAGYISGGCKNAERTAYNTVSATQVTVETAMTAWGRYCAANNPTSETRSKVKSAYIRYQAAASAFISAEQLYESLTATNAAASTSAAPGVQTASVAANAALSDLIALIQSFGVKL